jgi:hypothetical protein
MILRTPTAVNSPRDRSRFELLPAASQAHGPSTSKLRATASDGKRAGAAIGLINGVLVRALSISPLIVTLGLLMVSSPVLPPLSLCPVSS